MSNKMPQPEQDRILAAMGALRPDDKIQLIKHVRTLKPELGLADAKYLVERCQAKGNGTNMRMIYDAICIELADVLDCPYTKEQFIGLLGQMIDNSSTYFMDPLEAVIHGCQNLKSKGGLKHAAEMADTFINAI